MKNKKVTADEFNNNIWKQHEFYKDLVFWREVTIGLNLYKINGANTPDAVFQRVLAKLEENIQVKPLELPTQQSGKRLGQHMAKDSLAMAMRYAMSWTMRVPLAAVPMVLQVRLDLP